VPLDSSSTLAQIKAAYADNADYDDAADASHVAKAKAYRHACRLLLVRLPKVSGQGVEVLHLSPELIAKELEKVVAWLGSHDAASGGYIDGVAVPATGPASTTLVMGGRE
jgi:hypothetical protein